MNLVIWAGFCLEQWKLGPIETLSLMVKGSFSAHLKKIKLRPKDVILLKTKAGLYPVKVYKNYPTTKKVLVESDIWIGGLDSWDYNEIELIDTEVKKILYGA